MIQQLRAFHSCGDADLEPLAFAEREPMRAVIKRYNPHVFVALALALAYHGALLFSGTFKDTYDAYVHIFFADHYARAWFDHWEPRWYTGFPMTSYPPGAQQSIALLSHLVGLETGFAIVALFAVLNCTLGIYRSSKLWVSDEAAGYAALLYVFASSVAETIHVFGQLPTLFSLGFLLNALPFVYRWVTEGKLKWLFTAWLLNAATTAGHHVTTLFGAVFFVAPVILAALVSELRTPLDDEPTQHPARVTARNLRPLLSRRLRRILPGLVRTAVYGPGLILALVLVVLPYWMYSKADPITQVSIPHASRDSFLENTSAGFVFWLVPYGLTVLLLPYVLYKGLSTRAWPMALSWALMVLLGTGGTTPLPRLILRGAFDILTLDRFTFWATIAQLPLLGELVASLRHGRLARYTREQLGEISWRLVQISLIVGYLLVSVFVANLTKYRRFQPSRLDFQPVVNFLDKDQHWRWRYLTLGLGDQMAWLSAQTRACSVDGNYHSARRLPELTTTPVERLEGAKYSGMPGIGSLQQFIAVPDKYNLKFIFSNDEFYDPLLFFSGWHRLQRLENGIMVWEREDIPPLPEILPRKEIPVYQRVLWGLVPMSALASASVAFCAPMWWPYMLWLLDREPGAGFSTKHHLRRRFWRVATSPFRPLWTATCAAAQRASLLRPLRASWSRLDHRLLAASALPASDESSAPRWQVWRDWAARFPRPHLVTPKAQHVRLALLTLCLALGGFAVDRHFRRQTQAPAAVVEQYYDDLDFRRFRAAFARLDPHTRPSYDQYLVELSVAGGIVASYGKLDSITQKLLTEEPERVSLIATTDWVTAVSAYRTNQWLVLWKREEGWFIEPPSFDLALAPDQFFRRGEVGWASAGRRRVSTETTAVGDILDRPELRILSARAVRQGGNYHVVGELINIDSDPADLTVTAFLDDANGKELTHYNAQEVMMHKLFPKEVTPFRIDFEGVAGASLQPDDALTNFKPGAFTPPVLERPVANFEVYAKAVVTRHDLARDLTAQDVKVERSSNGSWHVSGRLLNMGTREALIPHVLLTYYDSAQQVVWVDHAYVRDSVRPQHSKEFDVVVTPYRSVEVVLDNGELYEDNLKADLEFDPNWAERTPLPAELGYVSYRISVNYFMAAPQ